MNSSVWVAGVRRVYDKSYTVSKQTTNGNTHKVSTLPFSAPKTLFFLRHIVGTGSLRSRWDHLNCSTMPCSIYKVPRSFTIFEGLSGVAFITSWETVGSNLLKLSSKADSRVGNSRTSQSPSLDCQEVWTRRGPQNALRWNIIGRCTPPRAPFVSTRPSILNQPIQQQ